MAKELPYFKFEPNQWDNGNIQILSREDKGLFIDLCSMYWSRLGDVPYKLALQKLCGGNATALNSLCDEKIIEVIDDNIFIKFLSEQLNEFENTSKQNSKNAKDRWEKHRKQKDECERNATALNPQCESDAIREEKIREEKIRKEIKEKKIEFKESVFLFQNEYDKLILIYNNEIGKALDILSNYKLSTGKKYASDYHVMIGWVKDKFEKEKNSEKKERKHHPLYGRQSEQDVIDTVNIFRNAAINFQNLQKDNE